VGVAVVVGVVWLFGSSEKTVTLDLPSAPSVAGTDSDEDLESVETIARSSPTGRTRSGRLGAALTSGGDEESQPGEETAEKKQKRRKKKTRKKPQQDQEKEDEVKFGRRGRTHQPHGR